MFLALICKLSISYEKALLFFTDNLLDENSKLLGGVLKITKDSNGKEIVDSIGKLHLVSTVY